MKQNKAMSWSAAVFIVSFSTVLLAPLAYLMVIGKSNGHLSPSIATVELFAVDSKSTGGFGLSYGLGALIIPAILSIVVWLILQLLGPKEPAGK